MDAATLQAIAEIIKNGGANAGVLGVAGLLWYINQRRKNGNGNGNGKHTVCAQHEAFTVKMDNIKETCTEIKGDIKGIHSRLDGILNGRN